MPRTITTTSASSNLMHIKSVLLIITIATSLLPLATGHPAPLVRAHAVWAIREEGYDAVMINSNPETVSTDFDASTRLYFEPLDAESIMEIVRAESPEGESTLPAFVQFGGQTPLNLAAPLAAAPSPDATPVVLEPEVEPEFEPAFAPV